MMEVRTKDIDITMLEQVLEDARMLQKKDPYLIFTPEFSELTRRGQRAFFLFARQVSASAKEKRMLVYYRLETALFATDIIDKADFIRLALGISLFKQV
jgi:hypothetical protein